MSFSSDPGNISLEETEFLSDSSSSGGEAGAVGCPMLQRNHAAVHSGLSFPQRQRLAPVSTHDITEPNPADWPEL